MEPAALNAIRIDPLLAEAHAAMGSVYGRNRDWANARQSFETALELNPSLTTTYTDFVLSTLLPMGRNIESVQQARDRAASGSAVAGRTRLLAHVLVNVGRHADAIESARWVLARDPKFPYAEVFLGRALLFAGRPKEALAMFENSQSEGDWGYIGYLYAVTGRRAQAEALAASHPDAAARQMLIYGGLGDKNRAFEALERTAQVQLVACRHVDDPSGNVSPPRRPARTRASRQTRAAPIRRATVAKGPSQLVRESGDFPRRLRSKPNGLVTLTRPVFLASTVLGKQQQLSEANVDDEQAGTADRNPRALLRRYRVTPAEADWHRRRRGVGPF